MTKASATYEELEGRIGYQFEDRKWVDLAMMHASLQQAKNNERLEFLGDAVLGFVISLWLYEIQPKAREGRLSNLRTKLVSAGPLSDIAKEVGLENWMQFGQSIKKNALDSISNSVRADALEALIAAVFMDGGFESVNLVVRRIFTARLNAVLGLSMEDLKNPKTRLQELACKLGDSLPEYDTKAVQSEGSTLFECVCTIKHQDKFMATKGCSDKKKYAEQSAAEKLLIQLIESR